MTGFILRALIAALGLWLATEWVNGVSIDSPGTLVIAGLLLGVVNAIVRPLAVILTFPITLVTLGLFLLVVTAAMVALVAWFLPGFHLAGFWPALWTALIVGLTGWVGSWFIGPKGKIEVVTKRPD
ncbi:MAG TPA: phage holin family protein [Steroidobacteraceae bacterium]|nr:phage holin family protein [Steroidobacteraceae bacterium]